MKVTFELDRVLRFRVLSILSMIFAQRVRMAVYDRQGERDGDGGRRRDVTDQSGHLCDRRRPGVCLLSIGLSAIL